MEVTCGLMIMSIRLQGFFGRLNGAVTGTASKDAQGQQALALSIHNRQSASHKKARSANETHKFVAVYTFAHSTCVQYIPLCVRLEAEVRSLSISSDRVRE